MVRGYVELDRRFRRLESDKSPEARALYSYTASEMFGEPGLAWSSLLKEQLVVVLGEPGSGKTWEFGERARDLNEHGGMAFFVRLEQLAAGTLEDAIENAQPQQLSRWKSGKSEATFFLDSVDEAKFHRLADFHVAIEKFASEIGVGAVSRAKIFLSCRVSEWQPETDAAELLVLLRGPERRTQRGRISKMLSKIGAPEIPPVTATTTTRENKNLSKLSIVTVQLEPLDRTRVAKFAATLGIEKHEQFVQAIDKQYAWEFARRPLDVIELANFWTSHNKLGSLSEIIAHSAEVNLRPAQRDKDDLLSPHLAREGAETLGAATTFCREFTFKVPDEAFIAPSSLDAWQCLPDTWTKDQVRALLARPVFDSASYGRIRFHHRRIAEYLTSQWLAQRLREGCPTTELRELLVAQVGKTTMIRPAMAPVAAWLCCGTEYWNDDIRGWVSEASPEIHLQFGDPGCLPLEYRRRLLRRVVDSFSGRKRVWVVSSADSLSRLADPNLADEISRIIRDASISADLRCEMVQVAEYGTLTACLPALLHSVADPFENPRLKYYAADAIANIGDDKTRRRLAKTAQQLSEIPSDLCAPICEAIYPAVISARELTDLLHRTVDVDSYGIGFPYRLSAYFAKNVSPVMAGELLGCLEELATAPLYLTTGEKGVKISASFWWVGRVLVPVLYTLLKRPVLTTHEAGVAASALMSLGQIQRFCHLHDESIRELNQSTELHPAVRRAFFWQFVDRLRRCDGYQPKYIRHVFGHYDVLSPLQSDFNWLLEDVCNRPTEMDRQLALAFAVEIWGEGGRSSHRLRELRRAVSDEKSLREELRRLLRNWRWFQTKRLWNRWIQNKVLSAWWWHKYIRQAQDFRVWLIGQWRLLTHIRLLASGDAIGWLMLLSREADKQNNSSWAPDTWDDLVAKRGRLITWATKRGCKRAWTKFWPPLPHEEVESNKTDPRVMVGLTGLQAGILDGDLKFPQLSSQNATRAARYGVNELNGFASWFGTLAEERAHEAQLVLEECITGEWQFPGQRKHVNEVMNKLVWQGKHLNPLVWKKIWDVLQDKDPPNLHILEYGLTILLRGEARTAQVAGLARARAMYAVSDPPRFVLWTVVLLLIDAPAGLDVLEMLLNPNAWSDDVIIRVCSWLSGERMNRTLAVENPSYERPENLRRLIPIIYRHVRPNNDIVHTSGRGYTPTARDDAQDFRGRLLELLSRLESPDVPSVLSELILEPELLYLRDWILHLIDEWKKRHADLARWTASDIRSFAREHEIDPKTDGDLFLIGCKRINEIKLDVEKAENSLRSELHPTYVEPELRKWLQRKLQERARGRYRIPQEAEIDLQQRPDLRLENPKTPAVSVEVK